MLYWFDLETSKENHLCSFLVRLIEAKKVEHLFGSQQRQDTSEAECSKHESLITVHNCLWVSGHPFFNICLLSRFCNFLLVCWLVILLCASTECFTPYIGFWDHVICLSVFSFHFELISLDQSDRATYRCTFSPWRHEHFAPMTSRNSSKEREVTWSGSSI